MLDRCKTRPTLAADAVARLRFSNWMLFAGFALTGAGAVMVGVLLPVLSRRWNLHDDQAGLLLFLQFLGSSLGAILTGSSRIRSLRIGYGLLALGAVVLAFANLSLLYPGFLIFGIGLGMAMTSTSMIVAERSGTERPARLERLNFAWSAGAAVTPLLLVPFLHFTTLRPAFLAALVPFLSMSLWVALGESTDAALVHMDHAGLLEPAPLRFLLFLAVLSVCAVGIESALSGWLTTYSHRSGLVDAGGAAIATSLFWAGIMLSRFATSTRLLALIGRYGLLWLTILGVLISSTLLIAAPGPVLIRIWAVAAGLSLGPLYPLLLSYLLERPARGWYFAVPGLGSAFLPALTGLVSARCSSLRCGLLVPGGAALLMLLLLMLSIVFHASRAWLAKQV